MEELDSHATYLLHGKLIASNGLELTTAGIREDDLQVLQGKP
jgi:hypothetical protein